MQKVTNLVLNFAKKLFLSFHQNTGRLFYSQMHFFSFLAQKMLKMKILTSVCGAEHPNAGRNIQQLRLLPLCKSKTKKVC